MTIFDITKEYSRDVDIHDLQLIIAHILQKPREFVLAHPEHTISKKQETAIKKFIQRRITGEPIAYITGHKEFFGLDFIVNKHTLVPRPETEQIVQLSSELLRSMLRNKLRNFSIMDIGTGSGNIIISLANELTNVPTCSFFGIDISKDALKIAKKNAKIHHTNDRIKFLNSDLLSKFDTSSFEYCGNLIVLANLPYLSSEIYRSAPKDVKNFEPKSALYSPAQGLSHYKKLLQQLKKIVVSRKLPASRRQVTTSRGGSVVCYFEISPEQKPLLMPLIKKILPAAKISFHKDLAGKWRICEIKNQNA